MTSLGVFEIFYGMEWPIGNRSRLANFLAHNGYKFFFYGPKGEAALRREWARPMTAEEFAKFKDMRDTFARSGLKFGMALSPQGLNSSVDLAQRRALRDKVSALNDLGVDFLGLFFDDMKSAPDMAAHQLEMAHEVQNITKAKVIFCPSYYCYDTLLDMLFGDRPPGYLEAIGKELDKEIEVLWTGESIISPSISQKHLEEVAIILKRKPFVCDNFYANDGPINCHFLKLLSPSGRERTVFQSAAAWGFNPMNQYHLSELVLFAVAQFVFKLKTPDEALRIAFESYCPSSLIDFVSHHRERFATEGLLAISDHEKSAFLEALSLEHSVAKEIRDWLEGKYSVDFAAMLEQSGYGE